MYALARIGFSYFACDLSCTGSSWNRRRIPDDRVFTVQQVIDNCDILYNKIFYNHSCLYLCVLLIGHTNLHIVMSQQRLLKYIERPLHLNHRLSKLDLIMYRKDKGKFQ